VLDLALSALGEVWSELTLTDKSLAVRLELPDEARRDFVAARLGELSERLAGRGLEPELAAAARTRRRGAREPEAGSGESGGLDLWA
jgi:hypothetical protein